MADSVRDASQNLPGRSQSHRPEVSADAEREAMSVLTLNQSGKHYVAYGDLERHLL
jgi:hypothetical protein